MLPRTFVVTSTLAAVFLSIGSRITAQRYTTSRPYKSWWTRYRTSYWPRTTPYHRFVSRSPAESYACQAKSKQVLKVDSSSSIASPYYPYTPSWRYHTPFYRSSNPTCSWQVVTEDKDYLELTFDDVSISTSYSDGCSCGRVQVRDGYQYGRNLGTFCQGHAFKVSSKKDSVFVAFYACSSSDKFKATIRAKNKVSTAAAVVVPLVVGLVLFGIIFAVIKKVPTSTWQPGTSSAYQVPLSPGETFTPQQALPSYPQEAVNTERSSNEIML